MSRYYKLTPSEWRAIERVLPKASTGRPRVNDRGVIEALFHAQAIGFAVEAVAKQHEVSPGTLRTRERR
jgi:hypothetical protein